MTIGVPFNIASYALLTHMVAHVCGMDVGNLICVMGDTHVYINHFEAIQEQIAREPRPFPTLRINRKVDSIDDFAASDFEVSHYYPFPPITMEMAV